MSDQEIEIGIPYPPDEIFKFRKNIRQPAMKQLEEANVSYLPVDIKYEDGIFVWYKDVPFPSKGHVFPEAMYAANQVKRLLITSIRTIASKEMFLPLIGFMFSNKKKVLDRLITGFIDITDLYILKPYYLEDRYYSPATREIRIFLRESLKELGIDEQKADLFGEIVSLLFQYDNAYYFRFIDIMSETSKEKLLDNFLIEMDRLFLILNEREYMHQTVRDKYSNIKKLGFMVYIIPSIRRAIKKGIESIDIEKCQMDEADKYHSFLMGDYNYQGKTIEQRQQEYVDYHGGMDKLPTRIAYKPI